jgi:cytochrome P450
MVLHPKVQEKAHAEIDKVIGPDRFPNSSDKINLPYVNAVFKEALRWHSGIPMGLPPHFCILFHIDKIYDCRHTTRRKGK